MTYSLVITSFSGKDKKASGTVGGFEWTAERDLEGWTIRFLDRPASVPVEKEMRNLVWQTLDRRYRRWRKFRKERLEALMGRQR